MPTLHLLRVFCSEDGSGGNALGVFLDDGEGGAIRIFTPAVELDFAGHPSVGTAWMLDGLDSLQTQAGELPVRRDGEIVYVGARPERGPPHALIELGSAQEVESLDG